MERAGKGERRYRKGKAGTEIGKIEEEENRIKQRKVKAFEGEKAAEKGNTGQK